MRDKCRLITRMGHKIPLAAMMILALMMTTTASGQSIIVTVYRTGMITSTEQTMRLATEAYASLKVQ